ncbi:ALDH-like protein [Aspergillus saccharolyticus JOP 1030-1]|uniref:aldehyde dehydrogenase (NAD(+)) n=1 Tax=Aspergillus saccharolyticus JOP 1030-1 TaxID=1450539 RepID=A0A318ZF57_9EURO|nr:ALDH-like protein [Aspergillus saccharolyticus JOP 1030-1]PYH43273.1 ALDH-like protein [Aspergillus saccharolyticus JOP 1030-1]
MSYEAGNTCGLEKQLLHVVNILHGYGPTTGNAIASHMGVRCLSSTVSSLIDQLFQAAAVKSNLKTVHTDLGGKTPAIVFDDANLESAAEQTQFKVQYPSDTATTQGSQADKFQYERVMKYLTTGEKEGKLTFGDQVIGPVVVISKFQDEGEVIRKADDSEYGLYASVFTKDTDRAIRVSKLHEAGTVDMPFGGSKGSGLGCEGYLRSLDSYLEMKAILSKTV